MEKDLCSIIDKVNSLAKTHSIGRLPEIRKDMKGKKKLPANVFTRTTTFEDKGYAFHHGGRTELQFNIGFELINGVDELRYGVAFSFETNQALPSIDVLVPKVRLFNEFIMLYPEEYADMKMWHYVGKRSADYTPFPIPHRLVTEGVFVFLGNRQPLDRLNYEAILSDLDRLLPLYKYTESSNKSQPVLTVTEENFRFSPGCTIKTESGKISQAQKKIDVNYRHNVLQKELYQQLAKKYGDDNVGTENSSGIGTRIDVVVRQESEFWFYEIKTAYSPRACLRQALGQLLEYAYWPGSQVATRLIVVGETALDEEGEEYLSVLQKRFSLPIEYKQIVV